MNPTLFINISIPICIGCTIYFAYMKKKHGFKTDMRWCVITVVTFIILSISLQLIGLYDSGLQYVFIRHHHTSGVSPDTLAIFLLSGCVAIHIENAMDRKLSKDKNDVYIKKKKKRRKRKK